MNFKSFTHLRFLLSLDRKIHMKYALYLFLCVFFNTINTALYAQDLQAVFIIPGGPGSTEAAQKPLDTLLGLWAKKAGLTEQSITGRYFSKIKEAENYLATHAIDIYFLSVAHFLEIEKTMNLTPIAQIAIDQRTTETYTLVVSQTNEAFVQSQKTAWLKNKKVHSALALIAEPLHLPLVVFEDGQSLQKLTTPVYERSVLSILKKLSAGEIDAALLDEPQTQGLAQLPLAKDIKIALKTQPIPRPVIAFANKLNQDQQNKLKQALFLISKEQETKQLLVQFNVNGLMPPDQAQINAARKKLSDKK